MRPPLPKCPPAAAERLRLAAARWQISSSRPNRRGGRWMPHDGGKGIAEFVDIIHIFDRDASVAMGSRPCAGSFRMTSVDPTRHVPQRSTSRAMIGVWNGIGKSCSRQHTAKQPRKNSGTRQCGRNGIWRTRSVRPSFRTRARNSSSTSGWPCASATRPTSNRQLEPVHCREKRERTLALAELSVNSEVGPVGREIAPQQIAESGSTQPRPAASRDRVRDRPARTDRPAAQTRRRKRYAAATIPRSIARSATVPAAMTISAERSTWS